jgi:proteasome activator subunit 4
MISCTEINLFTFRELEQVTLVNFVCYARAYFDLCATKEMLADWRPMMCPFDLSFTQAFELFDLFLPSLLRENEIQHGFK